MGVTAVVNSHYVLAKYIPEVLRNEPRNFGVIVWTPWGLDARFLGEENGMLDGRKIPSWVQSRDAYREWVGSWRSALMRKRINGSNGLTITSEEIGFLDALIASGKDNYILSDKGFVLDTIGAEDVVPLLNFLFATLVDQETDKVAAKAAFDMERACNRIIKQTKAFRNRNFHRGKAVLCRITPRVIESFDFDYYIGNGTPEKLYQRVPLTQRMDVTLNAAAWQFEKVIQAEIISRENSAALVLPTDEQKGDERYQKAISVLETQTRIIDLSSQEQLFIEELNAIKGEQLA